MNSTIRAVAAVIVIAAFSAGTAGAAGNIRVGQMEIHPFLSLKEEFSDNIYFTSTDPKRDSIFVVNPGIKLQLPIRMHRLEAEYWVIDRNYDTYGGEDTMDHHLKGLGELKFGSLVSLTVDGAFDKGHEGRGSSATGFIEEFRTNTGHGSLTYQLTGKSKVQVEYTATSWNFMRSNFRDRDEGLTSGYVYYRFLPKTSAFIEYDHKTVDFVDTTTPLDNTVDSLLLGVTWEVTARSKGTVKAGRTSKDFKDNANAAVPDFDLWSWSVDVDHRFTEETSIVVSGRRQPNETNAFGVAYFITTGMFAEFSHLFMSKTAFLLRGSYGTDKYSNAVAPALVAREDTTTMVGIGLKYLMKDWINLAADYNSKDRDSNIDVNDYREKQIVLSVNMVF